MGNAQTLTLWINACKATVIIKKRKNGIYDLVKHVHRFESETRLSWVTSLISNNGVLYRQIRMNLGYTCYCFWILSLGIQTFSCFISKQYQSVFIFVVTTLNKNFHNLWTNAVFSVSVARFSNCELEMLKSHHSSICPADALPHLIIKTKTKHHQHFPSPIVSTWKINVCLWEYCANKKLLCKTISSFL